MGKRPYYCSLHLFMMVRSPSFGPIACWVLAWTSLLITWSLYEICSILRYHLISMACLLLYSSAVRVHDSKAHWKMDVTRVRQSYLGTEKNAPVIPNWFQPCQRCYRLCYHAEYLRLGTVISYKWVQVLKLPFTLVSVLMSLMLSSAWSSWHWSQSCRLWRLCWDTQLILPVLLLLNHWCHQQSRNWWLFCL